MDGPDGFLAAAQECVVRAFGLGTGAWALWVDAGSREVRVRRYDARMVVPLTWDEEGVTECAFVTRAFWRGRAVDQVQLHLRGAGGEIFSPGEASARGWTISPPCTIKPTTFWVDRKVLVHPTVGMSTPPFLCLGKR